MYPVISVQTLTECWQRARPHVIPPQPVGRGLLLSPSIEEEHEGQRGHLLAQTHAAKKRQSQGLISGLSDSVSCALNHAHHDPPGSEEGLPRGASCSKSHATLLGRVFSPKVSEAWHSMLPNLLDQHIQSWDNLRLSQPQTGKTAFCSLMVPGHKAQPGPFLSHSARPSLLPRGRTALRCWGHPCDMDTAPVIPAPG